MEPSAPPGDDLPPPLTPFVSGEQKQPQQQRVCRDSCGLSDPEDVAKRRAATKKLSIAAIFCVLFMLGEVVGGIFANSLAILTDAAHLLSDVASFAISIFAIYASGWDATPKQSYGFHRLEILGVMMSIHIIWLTTGILVYEAIIRFVHGSKPVDGRLMFIVATLGLAVNVSMMLILGHDHGGHTHGHGHHSHKNVHEHSHEVSPAVNGANHDHQKKKGFEEQDQQDIEDPSNKKLQMHVDLDIEELHLEENNLENKEGMENINVRGAYLHVLGDLVQSVGVMIAGAIIWSKPNWKFVDLICTIFFSVLVLLTTINMWREIVGVLMESTPREINAVQLEEGLKKIENVVAVHELHIWAITLGKVLLACHVTVLPDADAEQVLKNVIRYCERDYKISHVTIQIERD